MKGTTRISRHHVDTCHATRNRTDCLQAVDGQRTIRTVEHVRGKLSPFYAAGGERALRGAHLSTAVEDLEGLDESAPLEIGRTVE